MLPTAPSTPSHSPTTIATLYALVVLIWGTTWIALKWQLGTVHIALSIAYRFAIAGAILMIWLIWKRQMMVPKGNAIALIAMQSLCLFCLNFVCFLNASKSITSGLIAVVFSTASLWNALLARFIYGNALKPHIVTAGAIGMTGLILLFTPEIQRSDTAALPGLAWALAGTCCFSCGNIISSALQRSGLRPVQTNAWGMIIGSLILIAYALTQGITFEWDRSGQYLGSLLYLAIPGSVIGFTAYLTLVGHLGPEKAAYSTVLFPVVALNVSTVIENYHWTPLALLGLLLVIIGNILVFKPRTNK